MQGKHVAILVGYLTTLSAQLVGLGSDWHSALTPAFIGASLGQLVIVLTSIYMTPPGTGTWVPTVDISKLGKP